MIENILFFVTGLMTGVYVASFIVRRIKDGIIFLNTTDQETAAAGIKFFKGADELAKRRRIILIVRTQK